MVCPRYKERVIGALILKTGSRSLRNMLENDRDLEQIISCDGRRCALWGECLSGSRGVMVRSDERGEEVNEIKEEGEEV